MATVLLCIYCEDQIDNFESHIAAGLDNEENSKCDDCDLSIPNTECLESHKTLVHEISPRIYTCETCNIDFSTKRFLLAHKNLGHKSTDTENFVKQEIEEIQLIETETKPDSNFENNSSQHEETVDNNDESNLPSLDSDLTCQICEKNYYSVDEIREHYKTDHQEESDDVKINKLPQNQINVNVSQSDLQEKEEIKILIECFTKRDMLKMYIWALKSTVVKPVQRHIAEA